MIHWQGKSPSTATRCHFRPRAMESLIVTELALPKYSAGTLGVSSNKLLETNRVVHFGENWMLSENGGTSRVYSFVVRLPNWQRRLSCVWFEIVNRRMSRSKTRRRAGCQSAGAL